MSGSAVVPATSTLHASAREPGPAATILVVDDDAEVREIVAEFLIDSGHRVLQADGGLAALRVLDDAQNVNLVITDVRMPDISGIELADKITRDRHDLKIILISGFFVSKQTGRRVLRKPFRMKDLEAAVQAELAS